MAPPSLFPLDPATSISIVSMRVRFDETDAMGIVHHGRYLGFLEVARVEWLRKRGVRYAEWAAAGRHLAVVEASCRYMQSARFDDVLDVEVSLAELRAASLRFAYTIRRSGAAITEGMTRHACVDDAGKLCRLDEAMFDVLRRGEC
jgi:acyl-CoA thioester hydrolase